MMTRSRIRRRCLLLVQATICLTILLNNKTASEQLMQFEISNERITDNRIIEYIIPKVMKREYKKKRRIDGNYLDEFAEQENSFEVSHGDGKPLRGSRKLSKARIIGGQEAGRNRFPYLASLTYQRGHTCGGSLIADDIILTAAHCQEAIDGVDLGRHNVKDTDEIFERFNIEKIVPHPDYVGKSDPGVKYNNDFMILKLYGWSKQALISLNSEPSVPSNNEEVTVMGWGVADNVNKLPSDILKEVSVNMIPNNQCRNKSGYINGMPVSFSDKITSNMMCATDTNEDACQGDSGGPLIQKKLLARMDVQVGVVSWGLGCAHQSFPGVYARVSNQLSWINNIVCKLAENPPDSFDCNRDDDIDEDDVEKYAVTVDIKLDRFPKETGWIIRSIEGKSAAYIPIGGYTNVNENEKHVFETVHLVPDQTYDFIMLDGYGDGLKFDGGQYKLWLGDTPYLGTLLAQGSSYGKAIHHSFYLAKKPPQPAPSPGGSQPFNKPVPTPATVTKPPTKPLPYITIAIKFDQHPEEIGWAVYSDQNELIESKTIGAYKDKENKLVLERIEIPEVYASGGFIFAILDDGHDGLCCDKGQGFYQLFIGDISEEKVVAKGSTFTRLEHSEFDLFSDALYAPSSGKGMLSPSPNPAVGPIKKPTRKTKKEKNASTSCKDERRLSFIKLLVLSVLLIILSL
mmetsp:Transcript_16699/g.19060  ORF Transcript_16699/g.19060 Transcript_16699/m.19060 type:complete len:685 (+) Transcript_16699:162-2216(+)